MKHNNRRFLRILGLVVALQGLAACRSFYTVEIAVDSRQAWAPDDDRTILIEVLALPEAEASTSPTPLKEVKNSVWFHMPEQLSEVYAARHAFDRWTIRGGQAELHAELRIKDRPFDASRSFSVFPYTGKRDAQRLFVFYDYPGSNGMRSSADQKVLSVSLKDCMDWVLVIGRNGPPELRPRK